MGMCLSLYSVPQSTIDVVLKDPPLIWKLLAPDQDELYQAARKNQGGIFARLFRRSVSAADSPASIPEPTAETDLDKAWHGIHYLLTGSAWGGDGPGAFLLLGGEGIGDVDVGYGPARAVSASDVQTINAFLTDVTADSLRRNFDPDEMTRLDIYPSIWSREDEASENLDYCIEYFSEMKSFLRSASLSGDGVIITLS